MRSTIRLAIMIDRARAGELRLETAAGQPIASVIESHGAAVVIRSIAPLAYSTAHRVALTDVAVVAVAAVHTGAPCALTGGSGASRGHGAGSAAIDDNYQPFMTAADGRGKEGQAGFRWRPLETPCGSWAVSWGVGGPPGVRPGFAKGRRRRR